LTLEFPLPFLRRFKLSSLSGKPGFFFLCFSFRDLFSTLFLLFLDLAKSNLFFEGFEACLCRLSLLR
jgi:hypothetical protein